MTNGPEKRSSRWPSRTIYAIASLPLAALPPIGLLAIQSLRAHTVPGLSWIAHQLSTQWQVYGYIFLSTLVMLTVLGWLVGRKEDRLEQMSETDPLTGLANRRRLQEQIVEELNRADRYETPLALVLVDLDHLKDVNDRFGHDAGDQALMVVAEALRQTCRTTDLAARHGGDEFAVLAVNTTATEALALSERILLNVRRLSAAQVPLTVSIGVSDLERAVIPGFEGLHASADKALYRAKNEGRDVAVIAPEKIRTGGHLRLVPPTTVEPSANAQAGRQITRG
jgi:diguanylate cyclase (GGDEF)-like protein